MRISVLLLGLAAVIAALVVAGGPSLAADALRASAALAGELFTIPLAATVRL